MSGRHQISADGKHLVDGVAFGRPRLKTPRDRPAVDIPPLKRRRITYESEDDNEEEPTLLLTEHGEAAGSDRRGHRLRARFIDVEGDGSEADEEDGDNDFLDENINEDADEGDGDSGLENDLGDSDLEAELRGLQADNEQWQDGEAVASVVSNKAAPPPAPGTAARLDLETLDKISALRAAFPTAQADDCESALVRHGGSTELAYLVLQSRHQPRMSLDAILAQAKLSAPEVADAEESEAESVASLVKHFDQHGFPSGSILAGTAAAQMAEAMRQSGRLVKPPVHTRFCDEAQGTQTPEDETARSVGDKQSGDDSDSDSESDSGPEVASSKATMASFGARVSGVRGPSVSGESESESDSGSESDSSSQGQASDGENDSGSDDSSSSDDSDGAGGVHHGTDENSSQASDAHSSDGSSASSEESDETDSSDDDSSDDDSIDDDSSDDDSSDDDSDSSVDGTSKSRSSRKALIALVRPSGLQHKHPERQQSGNVCAEPQTGSVETTRPVPPGLGKTSTQKRNARRRAARAAQNAAAGEEGLSPAGGPEVLPVTASQEIIASIAAKKAALLQSLSIAQGVTPEQTRAAASYRKGDSSTLRQVPVADGSIPDATSDRTHRPINGGSARSSPHRNPKLVGDTAQKNPEAWRDKIVYRAVECCQDGVELSEPPFPFVQRWDPQQRYFSRDTHKRGGGSKRKQRNQEEFPDADGRPGAKRRKRGEDSLGYDADDDYGGSYVSHDGTTGFEETVLNYDDEPQEVQEQPEHNLDEEDDSDLPPIPTDVTSLPALSPNEIRAGMILTWKQWLLSKATNWQPQVSALTGVVVEVLDGNALTIRLAKRDRNIDHSEKVYDDDGNRVYDKFELPGMDDEDEEAAEQGYRTLDLADMMEPRLLGPEAARAASPAQQPFDSAQKDAAPEASLPEPPAPSDGRISATPTEAEAEKKAVDIRQMVMDTQSGGGGQSMVSETPVDREPIDTSISEDRRHEISLLINDAGFRKDVDPSVTDMTEMTDNPCLDPSSPSRQLEEMTYDTAIAPSEVSEPQVQRSPRLTSQASSDNLDSQPIFLEPFHGFSDPVPESHDGRPVAYPRLELPPSETGSLHSGRQVDPDFSIELGNDEFHDLDDPAAVSRSTLGRHSEDEQDLATEIPRHDSSAGSESDSSNASFPSLSEVWRSASATSSKPPGKHSVAAAIEARKTVVAPSLEYEEAMRHLDDSDDISDDDSKEHPSKLALKLVEKPIEKPRPKKSANEVPPLDPFLSPHIKAERISPKPARTKTHAAKTACTSSPLAVPKGSQVISLLSSSPEPELEEHYADDSIDETYDEPSMPAGSGWVQKSRALRGLSVPASSARRDVTPKKLASSQSKQPAVKRPSEALDSLLGTKKKAFANIF